MRRPSLAFHVWVLLGAAGAMGTALCYFNIRLVGDSALAAALPSGVLAIAYALMAFGAAVAFGAVGYGIYLYRAVLRPFERLVEHTWELAKGADGALSDEFGTLGAAELVQLEQSLQALSAHMRAIVGEAQESATSSRQGFTAMVSALADAVASHKEAQAAAARAEEQRVQFEQLVDSVADYAIFRLDLDGRIVSWNKGAERMHGFSAQEVLGKHFSWFFPSGDGKVPERLLDAARREGHVEEEGWRVRRDGSSFWAEVIITAIRSENGELLGYSRVARDLTERKHADEQRAQLEHLKEMDQLKDQFLSVLSHELRTPINAIMGFGSILDDGISGPLTDEQHNYVRKMLGGAETLLSLVNDLLDMSRIQAGKFTLSPGPMRFDDVADSVIGHIRALAEQKRQRLTSDIAPDMPELVADAQRVGQVLVNLIGNAIKFTPGGGSIHVSARIEHDELLCEVTDTGIGIAADDLPKLFTRFTQLDGGNTRQAGGTGLGLSISKALIDAHGGAIGVRSAPDKGSTFWFSLPIPATRRVESAETSPTA